MVVVDPKIFAKTERLLLRPLRLEDADDVLLMRKHPEVMMHTSTLPSDDIESTKAWIQGVRASPAQPVFFLQETDCL
jgi:RimJ/RimL family protein N-acetyltransferase